MTEPVVEVGLEYATISGTPSPSRSPMATEDEADYTAVFARAMPLAACRNEVPAVFPYLAGAFDALPPDAILVMAVSAGGAATIIVPFTSRP